MSDATISAAVTLKEGVVVTEPNSIVVKTETTDVIIAEGNNETISTTITLKEGIIVTEPSTVVIKTETTDIVVDGGSQGPQGIPGASSVENTVIAGVNLTGLRAVILNSAGEAIYADSATASHSNKFFGITMGSSNIGTTVTVKIFGELTEPTWSWTPDQPVYLGNNGALTQTVPVSPSSTFSLIIGVAVTATKIYINPMPPIFII